MHEAEWQTMGICPRMARKLESCKLRHFVRFQIAFCKYLR